MNNEELKETGFLLALIEQYVEYNVSYGTQDKDRLMYVLCSNEKMKIQRTKQKIEEIKNEILNKGFETLSFAYMQKLRYNEGFKTESEDWEDIFVEAFINEDVQIFDLTTKTSIIENSKNTIEKENLLTEIHQTYENTEQILSHESELLEAILNDISQFNETGDWEVDFYYYEQYRDDIHGIDIFFSLCELLVLLNRLEMFESFLPENQKPTEEINKPHRNQTFNKYLIGTNSFKLELVQFLKENYAGLKGKDIAVMIKALEKNKLIAYNQNRQLFNSLRFDFGDIGTDSGINKYLTPTMRNDETQKRAVELHAEKIKNHIENILK
jgi:hypothetical protein